MPYLIKIGLQKRNLSKVTSKGYFITRFDNKIVIKFGSIKVSNARYRKFYWAGPNLPVEKVLKFKTKDKAENFKKEKLKLRKWNGYELQASNVRIYKWKE